MSCPPKSASKPEQINVFRSGLIPPQDGDGGKGRLLLISDLPALHFLEQEATGLSILVVDVGLDDYDETIRVRVCGRTENVRREVIPARRMTPNAVFDMLLNRESRR